MESYYQEFTFPAEIATDNQPCQELNFYQRAHFHVSDYTQHPIQHVIQFCLVPEPNIFSLVSKELSIHTIKIDNKRNAGEL